jgi:hypothetical protein
VAGEATVAFEGSNRPATSVAVGGCARRRKERGIAGIRIISGKKGKGPVEKSLEYGASAVAPK